MRTLCLVLIASSLALMGCGDPEAKLVGKWSGELTVPDYYIEAMKAIVPEADKARYDDNSIKLELKDDNTYLLDAAMHAKVTTGTWTLSEDGNAITLSTPKPVGQTGNTTLTTGIDEPDIVFNISDDGSSISFQDDGSSMNLTKE